MSVSPEHPAAPPTPETLKRLAHEPWMPRLQPFVRPVTNICTACGFLPCMRDAHGLTPVHFAHIAAAMLVYFVFFHDFGPKEHCFMPVCRWVFHMGVGG
jgi:hypothetical protein